MSWDPTGIVVGDTFVDYVEDLRETHDEHAAGGVQPRRTSAYISVEGQSPPT